jgi:hypothetical protein
MRIFSESSVAEPSIASLWRIFIAWTERDGNHHLGLAYTPSFAKVSIPETSRAAPAIAVGFGNQGHGVEEQVYIAWTGTDGNSSVNVMSAFSDSL